MRVWGLTRTTWIGLAWLLTGAFPAVIFTAWHVTDCAGGLQSSTCGDSVLTVIVNFFLYLVWGLLVTVPIGIAALLMRRYVVAARQGRGSAARRLGVAFRVIVVVWWVLLALFFFPFGESLFAVPSAIVMTLASRGMPLGKLSPAHSIDGPGI